MEFKGHFPTKTIKFIRAIEGDITDLFFCIADNKGHNQNLGVK
jgi:hypothetical protein